MRRGYTLVELWITIFGLAFMAALIVGAAALVYTAFHFVMKFW